MSRLNRKTVADLKKLVGEAVAGRLPELSRILADAGLSKGCHVKTVAELAQGFGVAPRTIKDWLTRGATSRTDQGYDVLAIARWRNEYLLQQINQPQSADADEALKRVKTKREELKLRREEHEVLDTRDVQRVWRRAFASGKSVILGIPDRMLLLLPDDLRADLTPVLRDTVDEVLGILSRVATDLEADGVDWGDDDGGAAATTAFSGDPEGSALATQDTKPQRHKGTKGKKKTVGETSKSGRWG